jgi:hypothetical protein
MNGRFETNQSFFKKIQTKTPLAYCIWYVLRFD